MEIVQTKLEGVKLVKPDVFDDHRGEYVELYNADTYRANGIDATLMQDDISVSSLNVLRGIHADTACCKLVTCLLGRFYLVVADCNKARPTFGTWQSFVLTERNRWQVFVPPYYGVAHLALADKIIFHYKQSMSYDPSRQLTFKWNDPAFNIWWPANTPILSQRDQAGHYVG